MANPREQHAASPSHSASDSNENRLARMGSRQSGTAGGRQSRSTSQETYPLNKVHKIATISSHFHLTDTLESRTAQMMGDL